MGLKKGVTNNPNGRPKGKPNKTTAEIKEIINQLVSNNIDKLQTDINSLEPKERIKVICFLINYVVPKLQNIHAETEKQTIIYLGLDEEDMKA